MEDFYNQPLNILEKYSINNEKFVHWVAKTVSEYDKIKPFKSNKGPWSSIDLILQNTVKNQNYWFIFKIIPANITTSEVISIINNRTQIIDENSSFFQNCKNFIFIYASDNDEYPIRLNIGSFKQNHWSQIFTANIFVNTRNGESTYVRIPKRFRPGLEYLENKILFRFKDDILVNSNNYNLFTEETKNKLKTSKLPKTSQKDYSIYPEMTKLSKSIQHETQIPLKIDKEQLLVKLKGILKIHSKVTFTFVAQKLNIHRREIEDLIYEASGSDQLDIIILDEETIALKKNIPREFTQNLPKQTSSEYHETLYIVEKCIICKKEVTTLEDMAACPHCANIAHKAEFLEWLKIKQYCPVCKKTLNVKDLMIKAKK